MMSFKSKRKFTRFALAATLGMAMATGCAGTFAHAADDDDDELLDTKIFKGILKGLGLRKDEAGIDYRERSPLVVPPKIDLPPPAAASADVKAPNWPKDPDDARRKAAIAARKKENKDPREASRLLTPSELAAGKTAPGKGSAGPDLPGNPGATAILSPSQLGYEGGFMGMFKGSKTESAPFKGEPTRDTLTMPPPGYQTPSPGYAYGTGPKESLVNKVYNPSQGKYGD